MVRPDAIQQIVPADHHQCGGDNRPTRKIRQAGQRDHCGTDRPDHLRDEEIEIDAERPA
jgi:hypothetical protein